MSSNITLQQLLEAGCHFGHQSRRWNPAMAPYIYTTRDNVHIFDLVKTKAGLDAAADYMSKLAAAGEQILFVGTKRQAKDFVTAAAKKANMPYVTERWLGGMLTNFDQIGKSIAKLKNLRQKREAGELKKYTKKEQLLIDREITKLERFLGGIENLSTKPAALFVVDTHREEVAVREAVKTGIPVIGMVDSNGDPRLVDYVIPINDDAVKSIELVTNSLAEAASVKATPPKSVKKPKKEITNAKS